MTTASVSHSPRHLIKAELDRSPKVELLLAIVAFVLAPVIDAIEWVVEHPAAVQLVVILVVASATGGVLAGLQLAGTR